jgi:hypothetical protein
LRDEDRIRYKPNPKVVSSYSYKLYEKYKRAKTVGEARRLGARNIDLGFDYNWGYMQVIKLSTRPTTWDCEVQEDDDHYTPSAASSGWKKAKADDELCIKVRVKEMSEGHKGLEVPRADLKLLIARCPTLRRSNEEALTKPDGPLAKIPLSVVRLLLNWVVTGKLRYERRLTKAVYDALKSLGCKRSARSVKKLEAKELAAVSSKQKAKPVKGKTGLLWRGARALKSSKKKAAAAAAAKAAAAAAASRKRRQPAASAARGAKRVRR